MSSKTITLMGKEEKVEYNGGSNAWLRNDGTGVIYAAKTAEIVAGADDVISVPAGQSAPVYGADGKVYLLGTGSVQLIGSDYSTNPFKMSTSSGGSGGVDEQARAAIEEHSGNADIHITADDKASWDAKPDMNEIFNYIGTVSDLFAVEQTCVCRYESNTLNTPYTAGLTTSAIGLCFVNHEASAEYVTYLVIPAGVTDCYTAVSKNGAIRPGWDWRKLGGNADTVNTKNVFYNSFSSPEQFGATNASSANEIWQAMPNQSMFIIDSGQLSGDGWNFPTDSSLYTLCITKHLNVRPAGIYLYPKLTGNITYFAGVDNDGNFDGTWRNIADGGNAASVGAYTEAKIAALEARIAALE